LIDYILGLWLEIICIFIVLTVFLIVGLLFVFFVCTIYFITLLHCNVSSQMAHRLCFNKLIEENLLWSSPIRNQSESINSIMTWINVSALGQRTKTYTGRVAYMLHPGKSLWVYTTLCAPQYNVSRKMKQTDRQTSDRCITMQRPKDAANVLNGFTLVNCWPLLLIRKQF